MSPTGRKLWRWKYRFAGKEKRLALGTCPAVRLKDARERRDKARDFLLRGVGPGEHRQPLKADTTESPASSFEVVALEWAGRQVSV